MAGHYINTIEDENTGRPVNGAVVKVYQDGASISGDSVTTGTLATIYSDDGVTTIDQTNSPITTVADGKFDFYTDDARVVIAVLFNGTGIAVWNDIDIPGAGLAGDITALTARVDKHDTVFGLAASATDLGTFTGSTISDNTDVVGALQEIETAVESAAAGFDLTANYTVTGLWDFQNGNIALTIGADSGATTLTDSTQKVMRVAVPHYTNAEEPIALTFVSANSGSNVLSIGGGTSTMNAATQISLYTGATTTTTTGTEAMRIASDGLVSLLLGANNTPANTPSTTAVGYLGAPQSLSLDSADYTLVMSDAGKSVDKTTASTRTLTIPANSSVAFPVGTIICGSNEGSGALTIAITTDTLRWTSSTGSRTVAQHGSWSIRKITSTVWRLTGDEIT